LNALPTSTSAHGREGVQSFAKRKPDLDAFGHRTTHRAGGVLAQASGIQLYLVVLLTGLAGYTWKAARAGGLAMQPTSGGRQWVVFMSFCRQDSRPGLALGRGCSVIRIPCRAALADCSGPIAAP
jgi:hypothetical protein